MKNPPFGDQGLAFQTHALQMILFGSFYVRTQHCYGSLQIASLHHYLSKVRLHIAKHSLLCKNKSINLL